MAIQDASDLTSFKWATVKGTNPLAIQMDGDTAPLALIPDTLVDPLSLWVGARVRVELSLRRVVVHGVARGADGFGPGDLLATASNAARPGWMLCQGQSLLRSSYPGLYNAIGTTYGAADSTHFSLPDLRGRSAIGSGTATGAAGATAHALGQSGGEEKHALDIKEMATEAGVRILWGAGGNVHFDNVQAIPGASSGNGIYTWQNDPKWHAGLSTSGQSQPFNVMPPYLTVNYMIKL